MQDMYEKETLTWNMAMQTMQALVGQDCLSAVFDEVFGCRRCRRRNFIVFRAHCCQTICKSFKKITISVSLQTYIANVQFVTTYFLTNAAREAPYIFTSA